MGLLDVLNGMKNGPAGEPTASAAGAGMSPVTMAVLGYLAYKGIKHFSSSSTPADPAPGSPGLGGLLGGGGLGGLLSGGGLAGLLSGANGATALSAGLGSLLKQFQQTGQGDQANSWIASGPNKDISEQDLAKSIGEEDLNELAQHTGMSRDDLLSGLRRELPQVVDHLTPQGRVPAPSELA
jgi:uncharacterized protein YidB (DUF937 family)